MGEQSGQQRNHQQLAEDQQQQDAEHVIPMLEDHAEIEHQADRHEKQAHQHITERTDVGFHLIAVFGFRDQHAGQECAQRQRQAGLGR
jgi:hypothetical protein